MSNRPIGVFDSGLGGLTAVKELKKILPHEDIVYLGDTARVPYGNRGTETIIRYARDNIRFMEKNDVKMIVSACATVSSTLPDAVAAQISCPFTGVVTPAAAIAAACTQGKIGIIGTSATIQSGSFSKAVWHLREDAEILAKACPLFVPLVENGLFARENPITKQVIALYLEAFTEVDTLILGCTHYPLLFDAISDFLPNAMLIDSGAVTARYVKQYLLQHNLQSDRTTKGTIQYFVTDAPESFAANAGLFLGENILDKVATIDLDQISRYL